MKVKKGIVCKNVILHRLVQFLINTVPLPVCRLSWMLQIMLLYHLCLWRLEKKLLPR